MMRSAGTNPANHEILDGGFDDDVARAMSSWGVPGVVAIAVRAGEPAVVRTYGSRRPDAPAPIGDRTLVQIASNTKPITALAMGLLVDEGRLSWDDPVITHIGEFALPDPQAAARITLRDLLTHQAGLPGVLGGIFVPGRGIAQILADLQREGAGAGHRRPFGYSNVGYALAGEVIALVSGMPWAQFVRTRLFDPLGMSSTFTSTTDLIARTGDPTAERDMFCPAVNDDGVTRAGSWDAISCDEVYAPAGGVHSCPADLVRWLELLAGKGNARGLTIVPAQVFDEVWEVQVQVQRELGIWDHPTAAVSYTLGWASFEHGGHRVVEHGGGFMASMIAVVPDARLSVGVFTNAAFRRRHGLEGVFFASALKLRMLDRLLGLPQVDWFQAFDGVLAS